MTEAERHLQKARENLAYARHALSGNFGAEAGRAAYMASFHAAHALIVLRTGKVPKTHSGTRSEFAKVAQSESTVTRDHTALLARAYDIKSSADYDIDRPVSIALAQTLIDEVTSLTAIIATLVNPKP